VRSTHALPGGGRRQSSLALGLAVALAALGSSGCFVFDQARIGVDRVGPEVVDRELNEHALTGRTPSAGTREALHYYDLLERFDDDPDAALVDLHRAIAAAPERDHLHAIAELCYLRGEALQSREHFLAAAVYAYLYLLGEPELAPANPYDRRFRWACDLYNRGLRWALTDPREEELRLETARMELPVGSLDVRVERSALLGDPAYSFLLADDYSVWGLSIRLRDSGLGLPLAAKRTGLDPADPMARFQRAGTYVPATAFLRIHGGLAGLEQGLAATLELHAAYDAAEVSVDGRSVPLETDFSATLALALHRSNVWKLSTHGFFRGDEVAGQSGLASVRPYQPGLIPVVFVHGTASNPAYWAEMFNLLLSDTEIRERMQFWFFRYASGLPVAYSAGQLRDELEALVAALDPEGRDPALRRMVLVGHSQGGLLVKLMAVDGDVGWWQEIVGQPLDGFGLPEEQEQLVRHLLEFDALPFVERVVFISTPHQGSYLADRRFARLFAGMIAVPGELAGLGESLVRQQQKLPPELRGKGVPTSLDNMKESNPFLQVLARAPLSPDVTAHSIIPIRAADPEHPEDAADGVVAYESAHIEGVASELCIPASHSCQSDPNAIREVGRILLEHLRGAAP
jgi:pimeloyl-ACP methyl ester carboxylesterase